MGDIIDSLSNSSSVIFVTKLISYIVLIAILYIAKRYFDKKLTVLENQDKLNTEIMDALNNHSAILNELVSSNNKIAELTTQVSSIDKSVDRFSKELKEVLMTLKDDYVSKEVCNIHRMYLNQTSSELDRNKK